MLFNVDSNKASLSVSELKKYRHKKRILRLLYKYENLSAPQICKHTQVSLPTAIVQLNDLVSSKYIVSKGVGESNGGRKPLLYGLAKDSLFVISCDMGRYLTKMTIFNAHNEQVASLKTIETSIDDSELEEKLFLNAMDLLEEFSIPYHKIFGIGIGMPGLVDSQEGINYTIKIESSQNIRERIQNKFEKLVYIDNDARMQAFGEYIFGKAKGKKDAIVVNWSRGIGWGMILNGNIYRGNKGFAGELSHIKVVDNGELCICGKTGCLETISSANTLLRYANEGISNNVVTQLKSKIELKTKKLRVDDIISAARLGDEFSISILSKVGMSFGKGLSYIIQLLSPEIIVLCGSMSKANQFVLSPIQQALNKYCIEKISNNTEIVISELCDNSGLLGVAATLYQKVFSDMTT